MATKYSKDKYARVKSLKNEPLSQLIPGSKKCKPDEGKDETLALLSLFGTPSSPTPYLEMMSFTLQPGQPLVPRGRVRLARAYGKILPRPLDELTTLLPMTSSEFSHPSLLMNWSVITFTNWCRYFS